MWTRIKFEPVAFWGLLSAVAVATLALLLAFDVITVTEEQIALILGLFAALGSVLTFLIRGIVTPIGNPKNKVGNPLVPLEGDSADTPPGI